VSANAVDVFRAKARECEKHLAAMLAAETRLAPNLPFSGQALREADAVTRAFVDQYVHRFSKLQDSTGKLAELALLLAFEQPGRSFQDILNRLEALGVVVADEWRRVRVLRNDVAHDYAETDDEAAAALNEILRQGRIFIQIYKNIAAFGQQHLDGYQAVQGPA
jgi:hypothetical protein